MNKESTLRKIKATIAGEHCGAEVILFGSRARGTETEESDWDMLVLLDKPKVSFKDEQRIRHSLYALELELAQPISVFAYAKKEWKTSLRVTPLFRQVSREGIHL